MKAQDTWELFFDDVGSCGRPPAGRRHRHGLHQQLMSGGAGAAGHRRPGGRRDQKGGDSAGLREGAPGVRRARSSISRTPASSSPSEDREGARRPRLRRRCIGEAPEGRARAGRCQAKYRATETAGKSPINECLQFFGGYGYMMGIRRSPQTLHRRPSAAHLQGAGTNEIMKEIIGRTL